MRKMLTWKSVWRDLWEGLIKYGSVWKKLGWNIGFIRMMVNILKGVLFQLRRPTKVLKSAKIKFFWEQRRHKIGQILTTFILLYHHDPFSTFPIFFITIPKPSSSVNLPSFKCIMYLNAKKCTVRPNTNNFCLNLCFLS